MMMEEGREEAATTQAAAESSSSMASCSGSGPSSSSSENFSEKLVKEGDNLILCINDSKYTFVEVRRQGSVKVNKRSYPLRTLIGAKYGSLWQASTSSKVLVPLEKLPDAGLTKVPSDAVARTDNRNLLDNNQNQKLSQEEILEMKRKGVEGEEIIKALIQNSVSFEQKTEFSQAKWVKKKQQKYIFVVRVLPPSAFTIATAYFHRSAGIINYLRMDTLARILTNSNVQAGYNVLVVDACKGLIAGAVAERIAGYGNVVLLHPEDHPNTSALTMFNFDDRIRSTILHAPFSILSQVSPPTSSTALTSVSTVGTDEEEVLLHKRKQTFADTQIHLKPRQFPSLRQSLPIILKLFRDGFDSIILAPKTDVPSVLFPLFPFLKPSQTLVAFSPYLQQLGECHNALHNSGEATNLCLAETWLREFQVLPSRTRPNMQMNGASGYLLSATKVIPIAATQTEQKEGEDDRGASSSSSSSSSSAQQGATTSTSSSDDAERSEARARTGNKRQKT
ncbi:tRNA (adenine(58)-N(1))-methyltransferase non-catalytic subunit TRM6 [Balamuthia mandrillaris]